MSYQTPEGKIKKRGRDLCKKLGLYWFAVNQTGLSSIGTPDDCVCIAGIFVHIEYKASMRWDKQIATAFKTLPSAKQNERMADCRQSGGITLVVDEHNIDDLPETLQAIKTMSHHGYEARRIKKAIKFDPCNWRWSVKDYHDYRNGVAMELDHSAIIPHPKEQ